MTQARCGYPVHVQSYFLVFRQRLLADARFWAFFEGVCRQENKLDIIEKYEIVLTPYFISLGYQKAVFFDGLHKRDPSTSAQFLKNILAENPLLKVKVLRENHYGIFFLQRWKKICTPMITHLIEKHLRRLLQNRPFIWEQPNYLQGYLLHKKFFKIEMQKIAANKKLWRIKLFNVRVLKIVA